MRRSQIIGFLILVTGAVLFVLGGTWLARLTLLHFLDFKALYYSTRCILSHNDPYNQAQLDRFFLATGALPNDPPAVRAVVTHFVNFPTALLFTVPFALFPWSTAHVLWTILTGVCYFLACFLIWTVTAPRSPVLSALVIGFLLASSLTIFAGGNSVGFVVSLTTIAVWCFIRDRFGWAGVLCLAIALLFKPHDAALIWLFFFAAGGVYRRRALQTLATAAVFFLVAAGWVSRVSPDWPHEQQANLAIISAPGGMNDPAPGSAVDRTAGMVVDLQSIVAIFQDAPVFYNLVTYILCGIPLLLWIRGVFHTSSSECSAWFALAAVIPLNMLITYHKPYDLKLLLLAIPASFFLWNENNLRGQAAFLLTSGAVFFAAEVPLALFSTFTEPLQPNLHTFTGKLLTALFLRPVTLILIALAAFYLTLYLRGSFPAAAAPSPSTSA